MFCQAIDLGLIDYLEAYNFQKKLLDQIKQGKSDSSIVLCQHYPVITIGRLGNMKNILVSKDFLEQKNIQTIYIDRGGDVTYHCPGQLVVWPLIDLKKYKKDLHNFLNNLEKVLITTLASFGIRAAKLSGKRGVFVQEEKIASIGIGVSQWVSFHGVSLNIKDDINGFNFIRPCGLDVKMTSMEKLLNQNIDLELVKGKILEKFKIIFDLEVYNDTSNLARIG